MIRGSALLRLLLPAFALFLVACSSDNTDEYVERPVGELYNQGMDALQARKFDTATKAFDEVERQHPYSSWATKAQLMSAYAYYEENKYDDAIPALDRFIQLHPSNRDTPYAYYLKALCYYEQISDVTRDQKMTELARQTLEELTKRFPNSKYARDASVKIDLTNDHLAGKTMEIGRYYEDKGFYLAALNRFKMVVDKYQTTTHVPEALHRMVECYMALGLTSEAKRTAAVLGHNFPGSEWYVDSYELVEQKRVRPANAPWYEFWKSSSDLPKAEKLGPPPSRPWYEFWGSSASPETNPPEAKTSDTKASDAKTTDATTSDAGKTEPKKSDPWYKFW